MSQLSYQVNAMSCRLPTDSSGRSSIGACNSKDVLIAELPQSHRQMLCVHLDELNVWQDLAKLMQLNEIHLRSIRQHQSLGKSPTERLLVVWGHVHNHYVDELYILLYKLKLYPAMIMLKQFVTYKYHVLIPNSRPALSQLLPSSKHVPEESKKILNCSSSSIESRDDNCTTSGSSSTSNIQAALPQQQRRQPQQPHDENHLLSEYTSSNLEINYDELTIATENWNEKHILGKGGFGTVYKGYWKHTDVAIKQIHYRSRDGSEDIKIQMQQSLNELKYLNSFRHDNVLPLYGYCIRGEKPCLVYQFMRGGCLDKRLFSKSNVPLTLKQRIEISLGTARGINYIHTHTPGKPLIHGDIKPANILLDQCLMAKIGDFGLAREGPNAIKMTVAVVHVFGTQCYLPPEFVNLKQLSTQVDTYSFGVTLFEIFTGKRAFSKSRPTPLLTDYVKTFCDNAERSVIELLDPALQLKTQEELKLCCEILSLGLHCTQENPNKRPEMEEVLKRLSILLNMVGDNVC